MGTIGGCGRLSYGSYSPIAGADIQQTRPIRERFEERRPTRMYGLHVIAGTAICGASRHPVRPPVMVPVPIIVCRHTHPLTAAHPPDGMIPCFQIEVKVVFPIMGLVVRASMLMAARRRP